MRIVSFDFDAALSEACVALRYRLHADDPLWIPPSREDLLRCYSPECWFFGDARNRHRHFVALDGEAVVGHVSALVNAAMQDRHGADLGLMGLFECTDDPATAAALIETAAVWLHREQGILRIWGPMTFDIWHEYRFRTKGHAATPFFGEPHNPPAYPAAFLRAGFRPLETWQSVDASTEQVRPGLRVLGSRDVRSKVLAAGWTIEAADPHEDRDIRDMHAVEAATLVGARAYTPPPLGEYRRIFQAHGDVVGTRFMTLLRAPDQTPAGLVIAYGDPADTLRAARWGHDRDPAPDPAASRRRAVFYFIGVREETKVRRSALAVALGSDALERLLEAGFETITFALLSSRSRARVFLGGALNDARSEHTLFERVMP